LTVFEASHYHGLATSDHSWDWISSPLATMLIRVSSRQACSNLFTNKLKAPIDIEGRSGRRNSYRHVTPTASQTDKDAKAYPLHVRSAKITQVFKGIKVDYEMLGKGTLTSSTTINQIALEDIASQQKESGPRMCQPRDLPSTFSSFPSLGL